MALSSISATAPAATTALQSRSSIGFATASGSPSTGGQKSAPASKTNTPLKTWYLEPQGRAQFTRPIVLLTCDFVFSGGEAFALAIRELPHVTIIGDHTNGIFSYQLEKKLPNGWEYSLSYQTYFSADMVCYEGKGVPVDVEILNRKADIENGVDPLITRALEVLKSEVRRAKIE